MKSHPLSWLVLFFLVSPVTHHASEPSDPVQKLLADVRSQAETGDAKSEFKLGRAFYFGRLGVTQDYAAALKWFRKAAEQNHAPAQYALSVCCEKGQGVAKDAAEAVKWLSKAVEQNYAPAEYALGICYGRGRGVAKDEVEAVKWFGKAAAQEHAAAEYALGVCCMNGQGRAKDPKEGAKWFRQAAEQGEARAQLAVGGCYLKGEGVARDKVEAHKWMLLAEAQGVGVAAFGTRSLTPEQIAEAEERAKNFKPRKVSPSEDDFSAGSK